MEMWSVFYAVGTKPLITVQMNFRLQQITYSSWFTNLQYISQPWNVYSAFSQTVL
jgi:hypothetical protein